MALRLSMLRFWICLSSDGVGLLAGGGGGDVAAFAGDGDRLVSGGDGEGEAAEV